MSSSSSNSVLTGNYTGCGLGAYVNGLTNLAAFQTMAGKNLAVVLIYTQWSNAFPSSDLNIIDSNDSVPMITWEPALTSQSTLEDISSGSYEAYVTEFIQAAKDWGKPLFLRFAHEMNGNWYSWDGYHNGANSAAATKYINAWRYIYNVRERLQADNVYLVWSPNHVSNPATSWNSLEAYYPGDQYVDWLAIDGYNWGVGNWQSFSQVFDEAYQTLTNLSLKPLMIGEFASAEDGGDKGWWITDALLKLRTSYPRVKLFCWFNIDKERDWRINSSATAEAAFSQGLQNSYFLDTITNR